MNILSIILYLIDVLGNAKYFFIGFGAVFAFLFVICCIGWVLTFGSCHESEQSFNKIAHKLIPRFAYAAIASFVFVVTIPSSETMKYIAISETVEEVITVGSNNETVKIALDGIKNYLKENINKDKENDPK